MPGRQRAEAAQGQHGRQLRGLDEGTECVERIAEDDAAAAVHQRPARLCEQFQRRGQCLGQRLWHVVHRRRHMHGQMAGVGELHVLGQVDQHRPGAAATREPEGLAHNFRQGIDLAHQEAVLDHRQAHAEHVDFLERIGAHQRSRYLSGDHHHRHRVQHRIGDAGEQVGRARA